MLLPNVENSDEGVNVVDLGDDEICVKYPEPKLEGRPLGVG